MKYQEKICVTLALSHASVKKKKRNKIHGISFSPSLSLPLFTNFTVFLLFFSRSFSVVSLSFADLYFYFLGLPFIVFTSFRVVFLS